MLVLKGTVHAIVGHQMDKQVRIPVEVSSNSLGSPPYQPVFSLLS